MSSCPSSRARRRRFCLAVAAALLLGVDAPLSLLSLEGEPVELRPEGSAALLVHFWATWCPSCVEELPLVEAAAARCPPDRVRIASVNVGEPVETVRAFLAERGLGLEVLRDPKGAVAPPDGCRAAGQRRLCRRPPRGRAGAAQRRGLGVRAPGARLRREPHGRRRVSLRASPSAARDAPRVPNSWSSQIRGSRVEEDRKSAIFTDGSSACGGPARRSSRQRGFAPWRSRIRIPPCAA